MAEYTPGLAPAAPAIPSRRHQLHDVAQNIEQLPITEDQLRRLFCVLDRNGNGKLDVQEFEKYFKSLQLVDADIHSFKRMDELIQKYGKTDGLSYEAFCVIMLKLANM